MTGMGSSCGACKFLRRRCRIECVFAPYFSYEQAATHFEAVHRVFGASNVSKLLLNLPVQNRGEAAVTISYEALARMQDPVYGCVAHICALQHQVACLKEEIEMIGTQMASVAVGHFPSSCGTYDVTDNSISDQLGFGCDQYMSLENLIHHQQIMELEPIMHNTRVEAGCDDSQTMVRFPSNSTNVSEPLFEEFTQTNNQQCLLRPEQFTTLN